MKRLKELAQRFWRRLMANRFMRLLRDTGAEWLEDGVPRFAAALSFYTLLSLAPLLLIVVALVGLVVGQTDAQGAIVEQVRELAGSQGADAIGTVIEQADRPGGGIFSLIVGVVVLLFGASGVFGQLQTALNTMWEIAPRKGRGLMGMLKQRFVSFAAVAGVGFLLLVSLAVSAALAAFTGLLENLFPGAEIVVQIINVVVSLAVITVLFALTFKLLPDAEVHWRDLWVGAAATAVLFTVGKYLIGLYLGNSSTSSAYGAAGSLVVLLIWVYYSAQIFLFGAELTQIYANRYGRSIRPDEDAEAVPEPESQRREGAGGQAAAGEPSAEQRRRAA